MDEHSGGDEAGTIVLDNAPSGTMAEVAQYVFCDLAPFLVEGDGFLLSVRVP